jgi:hypothetical protein
MSTNGDRLRRATQLWHGYLAGTGRRFELAQFLRDEALEKQVLDASLASSDQKLVKLAQDWLRDSGRPMPAVAAAASGPAPEGPKPGRYLRGVR